VEGEQSNKIDLALVHLVVIVMYISCDRYVNLVSRITVISD